MEKTLAIFHQVVTVSYRNLFVDHIVFRMAFLEIYAFFDLFPKKLGDEIVAVRKIRWSRAFAICCQQMSAVTFN